MQKTKKAVAVCLALCLVIGCTFVLYAANASVTPGDVNGDGEINAMDINIIKRVLAGAVTLEEKYLSAADLNGDGEVNSFDSNFISRVASGSGIPSAPSVPERTEPSIVVESVRATAGAKSVEVTVSVENNPGILAMMLTCTYDSSALTLTGATSEDALSALNLTKPGKLASPCNFIWDGVELNEGDIKDGAMLTLIFDVADNAASGEYEIAFSYSAGGIIDNNMLPVEFDVVNGGIVIG